MAATIVLLAEAYAIAGIAVALGFASFGLGRVMPHAGKITWGARLLMLPGAALLWPYMIRRWARR